LLPAPAAPHPQVLSDVAKQALRMRRLYMTLATSWLVIGLMLITYMAGDLPLAGLIQSAAMVLFIGTVFYFVFRSRLNLRCRDPNLAIQQIVSSSVVTLYVMYVVDAGRSVFVIVLLMIFLFGVLQLTVRSLLACAAGILLGYGAVIASLWRWRPEALDVGHELLQWCALAITLPWFALMGGFISALRQRSHTRNDELQKLLQRVQASEAGLAQAQRIAGIGAWSFNPYQRNAIFSLEVYHLFGLDPSHPAPLGEDILALLHPQDRQRYIEVVRPALYEGLAFEGEFRIVWPTGEIRWVYTTGEPLVDEQGCTTLLRGIVRDVTQQHLQQEELMLAAEQAASARANLIDAIDSLGDAFGLFDANDRLVMCNRQYVRQLTDVDDVEAIAGMRFEDLVRLSLAKGEVIDSAFRGHVEGWISERIRRHRNPLDAPYELQSSHGCWLQVSERRTSGGGIVVVRRDISIQKQLEQRQAMEYSVTALLAGATTMVDAAPKIIQTVCATLGADGGAFWGWDKQDQVLRCYASWSSGTAAIMQFLEWSNQQCFAPNSGGLVDRVWSRGEPVWIANIGLEPGILRTDIGMELGLCGAFAFPVSIGSALYGVMEFYLPDACPYDPALLALTRAIGSQIGQFIARKAAEEEIRQLAFYDPLTNLPNRRLLSDRLQRALAASVRGEHHGALLFIDLDNFKTINDTLGHGKGDLLLQQVAARLTACVRLVDTVGRQGGDEFVVMLMDLSDAAPEAALQARAIGEKILASLNQPYDLAGRMLYNTSSIGATLFDGYSESDTVLKQADLAMYDAKAAGRNTLRFFETSLMEEPGSIGDRGLAH
jgi:diguanylate cyclase (GGDEF)-like protein/PAS domain S-box-containing protein